MGRTLIQPRIAQLGEYTALAEREDLGFELIEFSHADLDRAGLQDLQERYIRALGSHGLARVQTFHGAFMDLTYCSPDIYLAEASQRRVHEGLEFAAAFSPKYVIYHGNLLPPLATYDGYEDAWVKNNTSFWAAALEHTTSTILIENMFDETPEAIGRVIRAVGSPRLKACLNVGHQNAFSKASLSDWFHDLGSDLVYCHLSDNAGTSDDSLPPGQGTVDWQRFSDLAGRHPVQPDVLLGIAHRGIPAIQESLSFLRQHHLYPFA